MFPKCWAVASQFRGPGCHEASPGCNVAHVSSQLSKSVLAWEGGGVVMVLRGAGDHFEWVSILRGWTWVLGLQPTPLVTGGWGLKELCKYLLDLSFSFTNLMLCTRYKSLGILHSMMQQEVHGEKWHFPDNTGWALSNCYIPASSIEASSPSVMGTARSIGRACSLTCENHLIATLQPFTILPRRTKVREQSWVKKTLGPEPGSSPWLEQDVHLWIGPLTLLDSSSARQGNNQTVWKTHAYTGTGFNSAGNSWGSTSVWHWTGWSGSHWKCWEEPDSVPRQHTSLHH